MNEPLFYQYFGFLGREPEFELGITVMTRGIRELLDEDISFIKEIDNCFEQYIHKDFGFLSEDDEGNPYEVIDGTEIMGGYVTTKGNIYISTSYDRQGTIIMLPYER